MTSANGVTATSVFDRSGRKLRDVVADPDDAEKSVTDARGNQTQQVQTGTGVTTTTNYGYDLANRLISSGVTNNAVNPLSTSATYAYNAQGQRVTRVEDEVVTHFYYTGSALLFTTVNEYVLQTQNILDPSGTIVASKRFEGKAETGQDPYAEDYFFYRYDIRGSVTTIVDGEGAVVKSYDYDEFGVTTSTGDAFFNEVTFTGSIADASGLLYMNARYYNPSTARFLSQDSYTGSAFDPWTQHLYAYCNNNPVNMVDPTGHSAWLVVILIALVTAATTGCSNQSPEPEPTEEPEPTPVRMQVVPTPSPTAGAVTDGEKAIQVAKSSGASTVALQWIETAAQYLGTPYSPYDATQQRYVRTPGTMDCSELVAAAVHSSGDISFPNTTRLQMHYLKRDNPGEFGAANEKWKFYETNSFTTDDLIPGDLIYWTKQEGRPCHVAVYVGDGYMIDATESGGGVAFRPVENYQMYGGNENAKFLVYARYSG